MLTLGLLDTHFPALVRYLDSADLASITELRYNAIRVGFPLLAFGSMLGAVGANYARGGYTPKATGVVQLNRGARKG
jgi:ABC-type transport system involved in cytochrome c biogenesis permease subunit